MPTDALKSTFDVGQGSQSATSGQAGRNNGPAGKDNTDAQHIKTFGFRELQASQATVDGAFRDGMKPEFPGTGPSSPSPRPGSSIFSTFECTEGNAMKNKENSGGGNVKSSMSY